jgi:multicomponent Na+:H+ antiporter subunit A
VWPFFGEAKPTAKNPHEAPWSMLLGPVFLSAFTLWRGLFPHPFEVNVGSAAASAILGRPVEMHLALWHGVDPNTLAVMALSLLTLALGVAVFRMLRRRIEPAVALAGRITAAGPARWYELGLDGLYRGAGRVTQLIQTGFLRHYVLVTVVATVVLVGPPLVRAVSGGTLTQRTGWHVYEVVLAALILGGAVLALRLRSRLAAVAALGVSGLCIGILFAFYSAPDLSMTQAMVEMLSVILLVLVFYHLPAVTRRSSSGQRVRDLVVAVAGGALMTLLVLASAAVHLDSEVSRYFLEQSYPAAHGRNVVNVILVDFRAFDTLGEVTVLAVAGAGVFALLKLLPKPGAEERR